MHVDLGVSNHFSVGGGSNAPSVFARNKFQYADDVDLMRGRHHIMFGVEALTIQMDEVNISLGNGEWTFNGSLSNDALADILIGRPSPLTNGNPLRIGLRQKYWGAYVQDDIQLAKGLNVHFGLRWEVRTRCGGTRRPLLHARFPGGPNVECLHERAPRTPVPRRSGIPAAYANTNWLGFAPRVGLAWDSRHDGRQSLRASYGIFFDAPESYTNRDVGLAAPWGNSVSLTAPAGGFANPYGGYPGGNPFPTPYPPTKNANFPVAGLYVDGPLGFHHMCRLEQALGSQCDRGAPLLSCNSLAKVAGRRRADTGWSFQRM